MELENLMQELSLLCSRGAFTQSLTSERLNNIALGIGLENENEYVN